MKILLTGAAGFIGYHTALNLLERGIEVVGIDNMNDYYDVRLKKFRLEELEKIDGFSFRKLDIENYEDLSSLFDEHKFEKVINLAARAGVHYSLLNPHVYMTTNANAALNLLELMRKHGIKKFVQASTSSLYAGQDMPFTETLPVNTPISPYAASKKAAELMAHTYHYLFDIDVTVVRYFTVYGPAGRPDMSIFRFIKWIDDESPIELFGDGTQSRDFTYVKDIAEGTVLAALTNVGYEIINLGGGENPISLNYVINQIEKTLDKKSSTTQKEFLKTDIKSTWADISKAERLLNWKPKVSFKDGLQETINWYKDEYEFAKTIVLP